MNPFFFGPLDHRLYGVYHPPANSQRHSSQVLLCPPFGQEAVRTHRLQRLLAEHLTRQGVHVMRFDYFGTGESAGADQEGTLTRWRDDILMAHAELTLRTRAQHTTWLGTRLGATLAIMASELCDQPPDRLILWEPILNGPAYLKELGEAHARETFVPVVHAQRPSAQVRDEIIGFGVSEAWLKQMNDLSITKLNPQCKEACIHLARAEDTSATAPLSAKCEAMGGARWQHIPTSTSVAWHTEEAGGSALVPPDLLRQLVAASTGGLA